MSEQATELGEERAVKVNEAYCSRCAICYALCPYDALRKDPDSHETVLEIEKCQVCGLCYSTCPAKAIDIFYYDIDSLTKYIERARKEYDSGTLVIMCKGSAPDFSGVNQIFGITNFIPLSVPCIGRVPEEVFLRAFDIGVGKINILACDEDYCRFERGSPVASRKIHALNTMLEQLGYGKAPITFRENSLKVIVDADSCITCGNCVFYCPYNAATLDSPGVVDFDLAACRGCGLCVAMCPAQALELENWESERLSVTVSRLVSEMEPPRILVFRCQWAAYPSLDNLVSPNIRFIDLPCASRVDSLHVLEAIQNGADGVMVVACAEDDCKQERSSGKAEHSITKLTSRLAQIGLQERLYFCNVAPRYPDHFTRELEQFQQKISEISKESRV